MGRFVDRPWYDLNKTPEAPNAIPNVLGFLRWMLLGGLRQKAPMDIPNLTRDASQPIGKVQVDASKYWAP